MKKRRGWGDDGDVVTSRRTPACFLRVVPHSVATSAGSKTRPGRVLPQCCHSGERRGLPENRSQPAGHGFAAMPGPASSAGESSPSAESQCDSRAIRTGTRAGRRPRQRGHITTTEFEERGRGRTTPPPPALLSSAEHPIRGVAYPKMTRRSHSSARAFIQPGSFVEELPASVPPGGKETEKGRKAKSECKGKD